MAFYNSISVELFDANDNIIMPVTVPISIVQNIQTFSFNHIAVQVETYDEIMREVMRRWANKELIQYRISGRFGTDTGDLSSVYAYDEAGSGEFTFYGRSHKEILQNVLGFIDPSLDAVQRTYTTTHKTYEGSALKVMRDVLTDNLVNRIGVPMKFQQGNLGNNVKIDFRFDEIYKHFYEDGFDQGGAQLAENGNIVFDIVRDFKNHRYELTAREPKHHEQALEMRSGAVQRWQITADRGEANRVIVGGPREMADRIFGSTESEDAPRSQTVAKQEREQIQSNIKLRGTQRDAAIATLRKDSTTRKKALNVTRQKALSTASADYAKAMKKAKDEYDAAMKAAKNESDRSLAKSLKESADRSAKSILESDQTAAQKTYTDALKAENATLATAIKNAQLAYKTDVATQQRLLTTLLKQWPYANRRFPAEMFTENTSPDGVESDKLNPDDAAVKASTIAEIAEVLDKFAQTKRIENGPHTDTSGELVETESFYLGDTSDLLRPGDYVKISIDEDLEIGEQQIDKAIVTFTKDDGYKVELSKPEDTDTTDQDTLKRILLALKDLSTKTRRR